MIVKYCIGVNIIGIPIYVYHNSGDNEKFNHIRNMCKWNKSNITNKHHNMKHK
jgi:hypothetical protein